MSKTDATVLKDGQLAVATFEQSGTLISGASAIDTTCLVQTEDGVQQCVKTFPLGEGGGGGTSDYSDLSNKPQINGTTLSGNKSSSDLGVADTSLSNLTAAGKEVAATMSMPSDSFVELTIPSSGSYITAISDGYLCFYGNLPSSSRFKIQANADPNNPSDKDLQGASIVGNGQYLCATTPASKGQSIAIVFGSLGDDCHLRFIYAKGSEPQQ